jgi:signal transduction histidine kinase
MSYLLHPTMVDDLGIAAALSSECERARRHSTATITERIGDLPRDVPHETALALFRIAQEALHNATRHASAECIELGLDFDGGVFRLVVRDDGKGFDTSRTPMEHGLGLYGMQERAALVRGTLKVNSAPGEGTRVVAIIPLAGGEQ